MPIEISKVVVITIRETRLCRMLMSTTPRTKICAILALKCDTYARLAATQHFLLAEPERLKFRGRARTSLRLLGGSLEASAVSEADIK